MTDKLLTANICTDEHHLIIDDSTKLSKLLINRITNIIECGAKPILINLNLNLKNFNSILNEDNSLTIINKEFELEDLEKYGRDDVGFVVDKVFVTSSNDDLLKRRIFEKCKRLRIPINTSSSSELSTFTLLSSYKSGKYFQFGITTNNQSCKLSNRLKREIVKNLPNDLDSIIENIGNLKESIRFKEMENVLEVEDNFNVNNNDLNLKKSRWLSQIIEYYPINKLSKICISDLSDSYKVENDTFNEKEEVVDKKKGTISLIGSGPGSISMLTIGALNEIYNADLILADKLIPQQILDIIPKNTELFIARKFPGNADNAQQELLNLGLLNLQKGKRIVRLKQGDPFIFGRGGEEYLFFNDNGFKPLILPGLTSALVAPIVSSIPTTHRDVIDQVLICTGVGKNGKLGSFPKFKSNRTVIFLMSLKKIADILPELLKKGWFENLAVCIVEKASCPDQRIIRTTLGCLIDVVEIVGIRPPSLLITGNSCDLLCKLPPNEKYKVEEGYNETLQQFDHGLNDIIKNLSGGLV